MNDYEKGKLREHLQKPGKLRMLFEILPLTPEGQANNNLYKKLVWMLGIGFDETEMDQVYYMLEEDGYIARDEVQPAPAVRVECTHPGTLPVCHMCHFRNSQALDKARVTYHLTKPLSEY
jgi:hypothetical protein